MEISTDKGWVAVERLGGMASESGAAAASAAEVVLGGLVDRVVDVVSRLREKQPLVSVAIVIVKDNNLASPGGQIRDAGDEDREAADEPSAAHASVSPKAPAKKKR